MMLVSMARSGGETGTARKGEQLPKVLKAPLPAFIVLFYRNTRKSRQYSKPGV